MSTYTDTVFACVRVFQVAQVMIIFVGGMYVAGLLINAFIAQDHLLHQDRQGGNAKIEYRNKLSLRV